MHYYIGGCFNAFSTRFSFLSIDFENVVSLSSLPMICYTLMHTDTAR